MTILLRAGSPSAPSRSTRLRHHVGDKLAHLGHRYARLDVRDLPGQAILRADWNDPEIKAALATVEEASAVVVSTPVYKAAYSGILKAFLDLLPQFGLTNKLVLPLATGGSQSHMLALDYALRPVLHALDARQVYTSIYATSQQLAWNDVSGLTVDPAIAWRVQAGVDALAAGLNALRQQTEDVFVTQAQPVRLAR